MHCGGRSIRELATGDMSFLEFGALIAGLPPESAMRTAQVNELSPEELAEMAEREPEGFPPFSHDGMLLAAVFDALQLLIHVQMLRGGVKQEPPPPLRRPGVVDKTARKSTNPQAVAYLERIRQLHNDAATG